MQVKTRRLTREVGRQDHIKGPDTAGVIVVEYGDYQCPYCRVAFRSIKSLESRLADKMRFVFRHFPLTQIHLAAEQAAEAAEAAGAQGKFWEMHDRLYEHQEALDLISLRQYASAIGLDIPKFDTDLESHRYLPKIMADYRSGVESGVEGTPTFFINGELYTGSYEPRSLLSAIKAAEEAR